MIVFFNLKYLIFRNFRLIRFTNTVSHEIDLTVYGRYTDRPPALELNINFREDGLGRIQIATDEQIFTLVTPFSTELHKVMNRLIATA